MELGARIGLVLGVLFVAERLKMTHFRDSFWLNEIVASLSTVDGSSLRRPFARGSLPIPLAPYEEALQRSDLPSAVVLVSFCGRSIYCGINAIFVRLL